MKIEDFKKLSAEDQKAYYATLNADEKTAFDNELVQYDWLAELNDAAAKQAEDIGTLLSCTVEPFIFVIEPGKDAAVGFLKVPDAKQAFKLLREMAVNYEAGVEMLAKAQLVRKSDLKARGSEGDASDVRFMDVNGQYPKGEDALNFNLLRRAGQLISLFSDEFKKK